MLFQQGGASSSAGPAVPMEVEVPGAQGCQAHMAGQEMSLDEVSRLVEAWVRG